jgi:hypothetical protein
MGILVPIWGIGAVGGYWQGAGCREQETGGWPWFGRGGSEGRGGREFEDEFE